MGLDDAGDGEAVWRGGSSQAGNRPSPAVT